jgi:4'-phosphopantetheinyl transferase
MELAASRWQRAVEPIALSGQEVHVWLACIPEWSLNLALLTGFLANDEVERAGRFRFEHGRNSYTVARALTRRLISRYTGIAAQDVLFSYGAHGKPALANEVSLHFNVSHSGDYAALAFTRVASVGVDIERVRADMQRQPDIAQRHFAPGEVAQMNALPPQDRAHGFFRCWSRKEAYIKARGDGIFGGLQSFEVSIAPEAAELLNSTGNPIVGSCWMAALPEVPGYAGAVCVAAPAAELRCYLLEP